MKKAQKSKQEIFEKAIELFSEKGVDNVSMRELAKHCGLSLGAFYYHFKSKEDLIYHFYQSSLDGHLSRGYEYLKKAPRDLSIVMNWICHDRFQELRPNIELIRPLVFQINPKSPISPWAKESFPIRESSVKFFTEVANHCLKSSKPKISSLLGRLLWIHHLLIIALWVSDKEDSKNKGFLLLEESQKVWKWIPKLLLIPGSKGALEKISLSFKKIGVWEEYEF